MNIELNRTQNNLIKCEKQIQKETLLMENLYQAFLNYECLNQKCWDLTKLLPKYNEVFEKYTEMFHLNKI